MRGDGRQDVAEPPPQSRKGHTKVTLSRGFRARSHDDDDDDGDGDGDGDGVGSDGKERVVIMPALPRVGQTLWYGGTEQGRRAS